jgi:hypothetical protein
LTAFASVQAGGRPPFIGSFAAGQQAIDRDFRAQSAAAETESRNLKNRIRVIDFERRERERAEARAPAGTSAKDSTIFLTQRDVDSGQFPPGLVAGDAVRVRDTIDDDTSDTVRRQFIGMAEGPKKGDVDRSEFQSTVDAEMVKRFPNLKGNEGMFARFRDTLDQETGETISREILGPGQESLNFINTPDGIISVGRKSGQVNEALLGADGEPLVPFSQRMQELKFANERKMAERGAKLSSAARTKLSDQGMAQDSADAALRRWVELGRPDLGSIFALTPDRLKSKEGVAARAAISAAIVPIKKHFLGGAVTPQEAESSAPLIATIEKGSAPNVLEASLLELSNLARRSRKRILLDARAAGDDISGFEHELTDGSLDPSNSLDEFLEGQQPSDLRHRVFVDENGQIQIEDN